jgi:hypothetical protein
MPERAHDPHIRGIYEQDEVRVPLLQRVNGPWTEFETGLFNLLTKSMDRPSRLLFSHRLKLVQKMLDTFDKEMME